MVRSHQVSELIQTVNDVAIPVCTGRITAMGGTILDGTLPLPRLGALVHVLPSSAPRSPVSAEIVACEGTRVRLAPLQSLAGVSAGSLIRTAPFAHHIPCGRRLLGRVVDSLGAPMDGGEPLTDTAWFSSERPAPNPLTRPAISEQLETGVRVIDGCLGIGFGQRIGLFSGPGLGKTTLLGMIAKQAASDVNIVCLVGERGREVGAFLRDVLGTDGLGRSVVVVATADAPPMARVRALRTATALSEWFRDRGSRVLLLVDSLTRVVRARRDVAFALGARADRGGFPSDAFADLPRLIERTGTTETGSITAIYSVLTEGRGDDPVSEEARSLLDGHIILSEKLAAASVWPAVDIVRSVSRVFEDVAPPPVIRAAKALKRVRSAFEENEDLVLMGAYRRGTSIDTDIALDRKTEIEAFLGQRKGETSSLNETFGALLELV